MIPGYNNILPFMLSTGNAGRLGGEANQEEIEAVLKTEVESEQERRKQVIERQFYDRILALMWGVEPDEIAEIPVKIEHNFETPVIQTGIDPEQFEMLMTLVNNGMTTIEKAMKKLGIRDRLFDENSSIGGDATPAN